MQEDKEMTLVNEDQSKFAGGSADECSSASLFEKVQLTSKALKLLTQSVADSMGLELNDVMRNRLITMREANK